MTFTFGLFFLYVSAIDFSNSTAFEIVKPFCSNPKDKPPHPENKSIIFI